ncbi:hypothetical protein [Pacificoceanicola onchidii]|uniref:hypothetical protein n=1 Tax=Pacificoceanicola onchidii TaxID=2562685 RepID=UPI0010A2C836|nr:hypothetical protein [Pacificoceanicola onchidii]
MFAFTPLTFTAKMIRATGDLWSRNLRFSQAVYDATVRQQLALAGWERGPVKTVPKAAAAPKPKSRARRKPSQPKRLPESKSGLDTNDMPV